MATVTEKEEYPKNSGIYIRPIDNSTEGKLFGISFQVVVPSKVTGKGRIRKQFKNEKKAKQYADKAFRGYRKDGESFFKLSDEERKEIGLMVPKLRDKGISITEAVEYALTRLRPVGGQRSLTEVISELQASKLKRHEGGDLSHHSYKDFITRSSRIQEDLGEHLAHEVEALQIKEWATGIKGSNRTRINYLRIASEIFRYARQKRYIMENPMDDLGDNDRKEIHGRLIHGGEIQTLTVKQAEDFLHFTRDHFPDFLGVIALGLFCGIRTEELAKLDWGKVNLEGGYVTIDATIAKKRRIRHITIPSNAKEWLLLCEGRDGSLSKASGKPFEHRFLELRMKAGFKDNEGHSTWPRNGMRHSFGSYHYALHGDSTLTSKELGHKAGDDVLFDHYRALATKEQGEAYFGIKPGKRTQKVLEFGT